MYTCLLYTWYKNGGNVIHLTAKFLFQHIFSISSLNVTFELQDDPKAQDIQ